MGVERRVRLKTLMVLVAIVAMLLMIPITWRGESKVRKLARWEVLNAQQLAYHKRELTVCIANEGKIPYPEARKWEQGYYSSGEDWSDEITYHREMISRRHARAEELAKELRELRKKWFFLP